MENETRRRFVMGAGAAVLFGCARSVDPAPNSPQAGEPGIAPPEDLMREHGALNRILLIYEESLRRLDAKQDFPADVVVRSATIVRDFIEQYHEKLEENHVFPYFRKANKLVELVETLQAQHERGRDLTATILKAAHDSARREETGRAMRFFIRMYRPHEAREDTVLFPEFRSVISPHEFAELGEEFETKEHELFGKSGFEGVVERIAKLEEALGIYDLKQFTPPPA